MRPESQGNNSMLGEDAAKVRPLDLSDGNNNAQQELASTAATATVGSASLASELSPYVPTAAASLIAPMLDSQLQVAMNMAGPSSASSSPMRDSSNSSLDSMTPRISKTTGTMKQRRKTKGKSVYSSANRAASTSTSKRAAKPLLPEDKLKAIECVLIHGQTKASVARTYRVPESTLRGWCKTHAALENKKGLKPQGDDESSASSARSESPLNSPLTYPVASLAANTCAVPNERRQHNDSDADGQFENNLTAINPALQNYIKAQASAMNPDLHNQLLNTYNKIASALPFMTGNTGFGQMALSLAQNNPLFMADGLQNAKSNVNNNNLAAQTSQANYKSPNELYKTYISNYFLSNQVSNKNNSTNDQKSQHTIAWISQQNALIKKLEQEQAQAKAQAQAQAQAQALALAQTQSQSQSQSQPLQKQLHQQQSQQQAANLSNGGTFSNVNSTGGWSPLASATSAVNSTSPVTSTVTSQNFNNKPSRGIKSTTISDNPLLSSQTSTNHGFNDCLNLTKKEKTVSDNQTNGSTITEEDIEAGVILGEKFMKFLEECGDPSVTQVQLNTLRSVIEKLKVKDRKSPTLKRCRKSHMTQKM